MSWSNRIFSQEAPSEGTATEESGLPSNSQPVSQPAPTPTEETTPPSEPTPPTVPSTSQEAPPEGVSPPPASSETPPEVGAIHELPLQIEVDVGQKIIVGLDGIGFFVSDDTIISIEEMPPNRIVVTGLKGGNAQILFWKEGVLSVREVTVMIPPIFSGGATGLQFRGNRPFFIYDFANFSSYSEDKFYQSPSYNHTLVANSPLGKGRLSSSTIFRHAPGEAESLERALVTYQDSSRHFWFGETSGNVSRLGIFSSASIFGSLLRFNPKTTLFGGFSQEINVFGGFEPPDNLLQTEIENQVYGANYSLTRYIPGKIRPDFVNASFFAYQPGESEAFKVGGVAEANYHFGDFFSLGGGAARGEGGIAAQVTPVYETEKGIVRAAYTYIDHGLTEMGGEPRQNEEHQVEMDTHWLLNDNTTILGGSFNEEISIPRGDSTEASTHTTGGSFSFSRQMGFRDSYGANYSVTHFIIDGEKTLSNSIGGQWSHSLNSRIRMTHALQYSRSDLSTTSNAAGLSNSFAYETKRFIYDAILSASLNRGEDISEESVSLAQNIQLAVKDGLASFGFTYTNPNLREGDSHQFLFTQAFSYPLTTVQWLSLNSSLAIVKSSLNSSLSGSLGVQYRRYFGPGVVSDPLWKKLVRGGNKSSVRGKVFWDKNHNFTLDEDDLPLKGVILGLDGGREAATDEKGSFVFSKVKGGEHRLSVAVATLKQAGVTEAVSVPDQTFTSDGREEMYFPIPVGSPSATLRVQFVLDTNENGQADDSDGSVALKTLWVTTPEGEKRTVSVMGQGGTLVRGLTTGTAVLTLKAEEIPENVEPIEPLEKGVSIAELTEYPVSFLFRPLRVIRGRIRMADKSSLPGGLPPGGLPPGGLTVQIGDLKSVVDKKGYFWINNIPAGHYEFQVRGIPSPYCLKGNIPRQLEIPPGSFTLEGDITLVPECTEAESAP